MPQSRLQSTTIVSVGRTYPQGVSKITGPRPSVKYLSLQNRDNQAIYFWFGLIPVDPQVTGGPTFPDDPTTWTAQQQTDAGIVLSTYGLKVSPDERIETTTSSTSQVYSYVSAGSAVAHLLIG